MKITYVNGQFVNHENAYVHVEDRGYQFSDGVYEVVFVKNNKIVDWKPHCKRLRRSLLEMRIEYNFNDDVLKNLVMELLDKNSLQDAAVYLQVSRGVAKRDHGFPKGNITPSVVMTASAPIFPSGESYNSGVSIITMPDIRWKRRDIKTVSLLPNVLAKQEAADKGATEAIFIEDDGFITEGSSTNFFIIDKTGVLRTHPVNNRILSGITREGVINIAKKSGMVVKERPFSLAELMVSKGAFITSTTKHVLPVTKVNGVEIAGGSVCSEIQDIIKLYKKYINEQVG